MKGLLNMFIKLRKKFYLPIKYLITKYRIRRGWIKRTKLEIQYKLDSLNVKIEEFDRRGVQLNQQEEFTKCLNQKELLEWLIYDKED